MWSNSDWNVTVFLIVVGFGTLGWAVIEFILWVFSHMTWS